MNFQNDRYTLKFPDSSDNEGIRRIFEDNTFKGGLSVQYLRGSSPYESFKADGDYAKILVIIDNNAKRTVAVGGAIERMEYLNGKPEKCAYLTGLKIHPDYRNKISFIAKAYKFLYEEISDCKYYYSTILDDNKGAISMLEKKHRNMPEYRYLGHYTTYCFHGGKKFFTLEKNNLEGLEALMKSHFSQHSLTPVDYNCNGFGKKTFYSIRENGKIIACCFVGNQQTNKQYKMSSYDGVYKLLSKLPTKLFGYPKFPKANSIINHGVISYLYVKNNDKKLCKKFLRSVAAASDFSLLLWGGFENNPLCTALDSMKTIHYGSRLYSIIWDKSPEITGTIGVEVGVL
ncbi:MAG: hypothetical protein UHK60_07695 [Acutalibacteraceae bacterium]|nr:hypothetical protein [Acutalibacteraceae bacterium]